MRVQRLSCFPPGQTEDIGWYFRDDQLWREYGSQVRKISSLNAFEPLFFLPPRTLSASSFLLLLFLRAPACWPPQSAVEMSSASSLSTLGDPSASRWARRVTRSTSPVCDIGGVSLISINFFLYRQIWLIWGLFFLLCSHEPIELHHRNAQECTQAAQILFQHREARLFIIFFCLNLCLSITQRSKGLCVTRSNRSAGACFLSVGLDFLLNREFKEASTCIEVCTNMH